MQLIAPATLERFTQQLNLADTAVLGRTGVLDDQAAAAVEAVMNPQKTTSAAAQAVDMTEAMGATLAYVETHRTSAMQKNRNAMRITAGLLERRRELADFFNSNVLQSGGKPRDMDWALVCPKQRSATQVYNISTGMGDEQFQNARDDKLRILRDVQRSVMRRWQENRTVDGRRTFSNYIGQTDREDGNDHNEEHAVGAVQVCDASRRMLSRCGTEPTSCGLHSGLAWTTMWS